MVYPGYLNRIYLMVMRITIKVLKVLVVTVVVLFLIYASISTYLWARQAHFIFSPQRFLANTPAEYQLPFEDVYVAVGRGNPENERLHAWLIPAEHPGGRYLIYFHGSALNIGANITHARRFLRLGFSVLLVSYRGYGKSDGDFPSESQMYLDAQSAWDYLVEKRGIDPGLIFVYGHSLGGAVAIQLAVNQPETGGLIVEAAFTSIADMARRSSKYRIFPIELIVSQRFDSINKVGRLTVPVLYIHGTDDQLVPPEMSKQLHDQTASAKQLKLILGGGHNNSAAVGGEEYLRAVRQFIDMAQIDI